MEDFGLIRAKLRRRGFILALMVLITYPAAVHAHEFTYSVGVICDKTNHSVKIDFGGNANAAMYDFDSLPQYTQHKKAKIVCAFGPERQVSLIGGRNDEHPNEDNLSVMVNEEAVVGRLWMQFGGYITVSFPRGSEVHVEDCATTAYSTKDDKCQVSDFQTEFTPTSVNSPSFDCAKVETSAERLICDDASLSATDRALAKAYSRALESGGDRSNLISEQKMWVRFTRWTSCLPAERGLYPLDIDGAKGCLKKVYNARIDALNEGVDAQHESLQDWLDKRNGSQHP